MPPEGDYTTEELSELVRSLEDADIHRLESAARLLALKCRGEAKELVGEVVERALDGRRVCPKRMHVMAFLFGVMRSVASEWSDRIDAERGSVDESRWGTPADVEVDDVRDERPGADEGLLAAERGRRERAIVAEVRTMFEGNELAWFIIEADIEGSMSVEELCMTLDINRKRYDAVRKQIRRGLNEIRDRYAGRRP